MVNIKEIDMYVSTNSMNTYLLVVKKVVINKESLVRRIEGNIRGTCMDMSTEYQYLPACG